MLQSQTASILADGSRCCFSVSLQEYISESYFVMLLIHFSTLALPVRFSCP